jgi:hypothetical protein
MREVKSEVAVGLEDRTCEAVSKASQQKMTTVKWLQLKNPNYGAHIEK